MVDPRSLQALKEWSTRRCEALRIFRALPHQEDFFRCNSRERLALGGNRAGKSLCSAVWFSAMALDKPVFDHQGNEIETRRPDQKGRPLTMWCVGLGQSHIGQTLYRLLFRAGAFKMVLDDGNWRSYRPWDDGDASNPDSPDPRAAPPLIPARYIKPNSFAWENKGERVFTRCEIINPETGEVTAEIYAFTSSGDVKAGDPVDVIWIDEAIKYPSHYAEWQARLIDRNGILLWSSWPDITNNALIDLSERAEKYEGQENPPVSKFVFTMSENPFLDKDSKQLAREGWSETERRARDLGQFVTDELLMYPSFSPDIHAAIQTNRDHDDEISRVLRRRNGEPPSDWTRELVLDPGTTNPAVLFCAVPPPVDFGEAYVVYDEICIPRLDADQLASEVRRKAFGYHFERFIIDAKAGKQTAMGFGRTVASNYSRAFEEKGLSCRQSGSMFTAGSADVAARIGMLQDVLRVMPGGHPRLRVVIDRCPNLVKQMGSYRKRITRGMVDEFLPSPNQKIDAATCLEYWISRTPSWIEPPGGHKRGTSQMHDLYNYFCHRFGNKKSKENGDTVYLGPTTAR